MRESLFRFVELAESRHLTQRAHSLPDLRDGRMLVRERSPEMLGAALAAILADPPGPDVIRASVADLSWAASLAALEECLEDAVRGAREAV